MEEYNRLKAQENRDEKLYGQFEALRTRASQVGEFDSLAAADDFTGIAKLARAWDASIRKELLEAASKQLDTKDKEAGEALNKQVLTDLKALDALAKDSKKEDVPTASATLRGHVLDFVALEPKRLTEKFGIEDL